MGNRGRYPAEIHERAVRLVLENQVDYESQWAAICSMADKVGCSHEALRKWVRQAERNSGKREGLTTDERTRMKELEREASRSRVGLYSRSDRLVVLIARIVSIVRRLTTSRQSDKLIRNGCRRERGEMPAWLIRSAESPKKTLACMALARTDAK